MYGRNWGDTFIALAFLLMALPFEVAATIGFCTFVYLIFVWHPIALFPMTMLAGISIFLWRTVWTLIEDIRDA